VFTKVIPFWMGYKACVAVVAKEAEFEKCLEHCRVNESMSAVTDYHVDFSLAC
jgi:hypothetical protein